jgi:phosphopantetheinyl transferase (holo-ACP synthase)
MMRLREADLVREIESGLGIPLRISISSEPAAIGRLTEGERECLRKLEVSPERSSWLKGRSALKRLLSSLGEDDDTSLISFPNSRFSLTHSGEVAIAVGTNSAELSGIGVDLELNRPVREGTARLFLNAEEQAWLLGRHELLRSKALLRLWTIKEALYKADPSNSERWLTDYEIESPAAPWGNAFVRGDEPCEFCYSCFELVEGFLTVAILPRRQSDA